MSTFPKFNFLFDEPMSKHTYTQLGGNADCLFFPNDENELSSLLSFSNIHEIPIFILGNGSNLIIRDGGIQGIIISTINLNSIKLNDTTISAECGSKIIDVSFFAADHSLTGLEFACGIPGTTGGAVFMNAGAYGGETKTVLERVKALDMKGNVHYFSRDELDLEYRHSVFQNNDLFILESFFSLEIGNKEQILEKMVHLNELRRNSQPLEFPSCGSVFKRPVGYYAGKLIQESELQGFSIGGAEVSMKHAGFVVNKANANSSEYISVIEHIQKTVLEKFDVQLEREVKIVGKE
jgi:UDP-N-acetylmuramate dehydrogenase